MSVKKVFSVLIIASMSIYIFVLYYMLFVGFGRGMVVMSESMIDDFSYWNSVNLIPLKTVALYVSDIGGGIKSHATRNLFGNLLLFFPVGFYLPFLAKKARKIGIYITILATVIIAIEIIQLITMSGSLDIDDFILNFAGALIGFIVFVRLPACRLLELRAW